MELIQSIPLSIKFILNSYPKVQPVYVVYAQLIFNRQKATISMKMKATIDEWDLESGFYKSNKQFNLARNNKLREIKDSLLNIYFLSKKSGLPISVQQIKKNYNGDDVKTNDISFVDYFKGHIEELKQRKSEYQEGTIVHYIKTQLHLHRFLKLNGWMNIKVNELSRKFLERFEHYLLTTPNKQTGRAMNGNTATTYIRKIKASINDAIRKELIQVNPFIGFKVKTFKQAHKVFLTLDDLEILKNNDLKGNLSLLRAKDAFLFACYTGLRHSDMMQLNESMIKKDSEGLYWISLTQQKTGDAVELPMLDYAVEIYLKHEAYRKTNNGKAIPVLSNQKVNSALKRISILTGINKSLSFHCARHTFATTALEQGVDIKTVSALLGHNSIKSTEIYARMTRKRKGDVIRQLNQMNNPINSNESLNKE